MMAAVRSGSYADLCQLSGVPIKKLGITDAEQLEALEGEYGDVAKLELIEGILRPTLDVGEAMDQGYGY